MDTVLDDIAPMRPVVLDKSLSEGLNNMLCQLRWNLAGTKVDWGEQGPHKLIKFGSGVELGNLTQAELDGFSVLKETKIVLFYSAYEAPLLIGRELLVNYWMLLDGFIATKFFLIPYQDVVDMRIGKFIECDPLSFIVGHVSV